MRTAVQEAVRDFVKQNGIKQRYISEVTGIKEYSISDIFCLRREMRADEFLKICIAIRKSPDDFTITVDNKSA